LNYNNKVIKMSKTNTIQLEKQETHQQSGVSRILRVVGLTIGWAFLSALAIGSLAAAIWTAIPTALLPWGASGMNLLGYVSHCSYTPISTLVLGSTSLVGFGRSYKMKSARTIGKIVYLGTTGGLLIALLGGVDVTMFIGMGIGLGIAVVLGFIVGIARRVDV
jgi:hypothetical protein